MDDETDRMKAAWGHMADLALHLRRVSWRSSRAWSFLWIQSDTIRWILDTEIAAAGVMNSSLSDRAWGRIHDVMRGVDRDTQDAWGIKGQVSDEMKGGW